MSQVTFTIEGGEAHGYLATPPGGSGPGVLVLHAWWGLKPSFTGVCDRLAEAGFVALAPDLYAGLTADTVDEATALLEKRDVGRMEATVVQALQVLRDQPGRVGAGIGVIGFSMGAAWAVVSSVMAPEAIKAVVIFYGTDGTPVQSAQAAYQGHFASDDPWEPMEGVQQMEGEMRAAGRPVEFHLYPGTNHWFFESDRPEYHPAAAQEAWERTVAFLHQQLGGDGAEGTPQG